MATFDKETEDVMDVNNSLFKNKVKELGGCIEGQTVYFPTVYAKVQFEKWVADLVAD